MLSSSSFEQFGRAKSDNARKEPVRRGSLYCISVTPADHLKGKIQIHKTEIPEG
jgi:hypothetical protein